MKNTKNKNIHIGSISPVNGKHETEIFCKSLEAMCELGFNISVLAEGDQATQNCCFNLLEKYPEQFQVLESMSSNKKIILESVDSVIFSENPAKKDLAEIIAHNIVPILPEGNGLKDFDLKNETGEAFTFKEGSIWSFVSALVRANENFKFPYDWKTLKHNLEMIVF
jgi:hypothetical protein